MAEWLFSFSGGCQRSSARQDVPPGTKTKTDKWQIEGERSGNDAVFPGFLDFTCVFSDKRRWKSELHIRRHTMLQLGTIHQPNDCLRTFREFLFLPSCQFKMSALTVWKKKNISKGLCDLFFFLKSPFLIFSPHSFHLKFQTLSRCFICRLCPEVQTVRMTKPELRNVHPVSLQTSQTHCYL